MTQSTHIDMQCYNSFTYSLRDGIEKLFEYLIYTVWMRQLLIASFIQKGGAIFLDFEQLQEVTSNPVFILGINGRGGSWQLRW